MLVLIFLETAAPYIIYIHFAKTTNILIQITRALKMTIKFSKILISRASTPNTARLADLF